MFTGIVEELGVVRAIDVADGSATLAIACERVTAGTHVGDSINVNGCCLTVTRLAEPDGFAADVMGETLARTGIGRLRPGERVNLERSLRPDGRLGGHIVQGHVDGVTTVADIIDHGEWTVMRFDLPADLAPYIVEKGSITVDGTSLTVMAVEVDHVGAEHFEVGLIPHTLAVTVLGLRRIGDVVNLEVDIIAKYVERLLARGADTPYHAASPPPATSPPPPNTGQET